MKKSTKMWLKQKLAWVLIVLMSINSFAAVVGDNDGAAFITKAEFESLKNDFQSQINRYNSSLDNKIDGAIAAYLAGVSIAQKLAVKPLVANWDKIRWMHGPFVYNNIRDYTLCTTEAGHYVDRTGWHFMEQGNFRRFGSQAYFWFFAAWRIQFAMGFMGFLANPSKVYKEIGWYTTNGYPAPTFLELEQIDGEWVVPIGPVFQKERGFWDTVIITDGIPYNSGDLRRFAGPSTGTSLNFNNPNNQRITLKEGTTHPNAMVDLIIDNIELKNYAGTTTSTTSLAVYFPADLNQNLLPSWINRTWLWDEADRNAIGGTGDGWGGWFSPGGRVDDGLQSQMKWRTQSQAEKDEENFVYAMWGVDVAGDFNVAPMRSAHASTGLNVLNLAGSGNTTPITLDVYNPGFMGANGRDVVSNQLHRAVAHGRSDNQKAGSFILNVPLFYRVGWSELCSKAYPDTIHGGYLSKSAGMPLLNDAQNSGEFKVEIEYKEYANTDTSVVGLSPDDKVKSYFKNGPFNTTSSFCDGYANLNGTGSLVSLNGQEWTTNKIQVNIPVDKGDSVWMRLDPVSEDGVYCKIATYSCILQSE